MLPIYEKRGQTEAADAAYVRCTMYDGGAWQRPCTKYEARCTIVMFARTARGRRSGSEGMSMKFAVSTHRKLGTGKGRQKGLKTFPSEHKFPPPCISGR